MPVSISKAQKGAIKSGFLDTIGSNEAFEPAESLSALVELAALLIETAQQNLQADGQISSGQLADSFKVLDPIKTGNVITLQIEAAKYFDFQNKGVAGIGSGSSSAGYSFKTPHPSQDMVAEIQKWLSRAGATTANSSKKHSISANEKKNNAISEIDKAYGVAMAIKMGGIKGSGYFDRAIKIAQQYAGEVLGTALAVDIINSLPTKLNNGNNNTK